jgi:ribosome-binding factor A
MVQDRITTLIRRKANDARLSLVTITDVVVTPDTVRADVHYSVLGGSQERAEAQAGLDSAAGWLRREIGRSLRLRNTPELVFHYDPSLERGEHIAGILDALKTEDDDTEDITAES